MPETIKYTCSCCGKEHTEWPALAYDSPSNYHWLSEEDKQNIGELTSDFCIIRHGDQTDRFIRVVLNQKVVDHCEDLGYGLWVSLSEKGYNDYAENFDNDNHEAEYFGWLNSNLPDYDFSTSIPTTVVKSPGNNRPEIFPHKSFDHPFVKDYYNGITKQEAERRIHAMLKIVAERDNVPEIKKPWWKVW